MAEGGEMKEGEVKEGEIKEGMIVTVGYDRHQPRQRQRGPLLLRVRHDLRWDIVLDSYSMHHIWGFGCWLYSFSYIIIILLFLVVRFCCIVTFSTRKGFATFGPLQKWFSVRT